VRTNASTTPIAPHANPLRLHGFLDRADPSRATYAVAFEGAIARRARARRVLARAVDSMDSMGAPFDSPSHPPITTHQ
jgi:hypothetical protein|tara:strand:+ start:2223 stop:2456 length:234 start_codon:yes stop_codon:yes gene_type:complete